MKGHAFTWLEGDSTRENAAEFLMEHASRHLPPGTGFELRGSYPKMDWDATRKRFGLAWYVPDGPLDGRGSVENPVYDPKAGIYRCGAYKTGDS